MTISTEPSPLSYNGDDSTLAFPITWNYFAKSHVVATLRSAAGVETTWVLDTDYTLTAVNLGSGTLTATVAPATGETLVISLDPPNTQETSLPIGGPLPSPSIEDALDLAAQRSGKLESLFDRTVRVPKTDTASGGGMEIPIDTVRASKFLAFDASGNPIASDGTSDNLGPVTAFANTLLDDADALTAKATLKTLFHDINSQTTTYTAVAGDEGKLIVFTGAGGVTLNLLAAATAASGFSVGVQNSTTGTVTIDPNAAELINGAATLILAPGESAILVSTSAAWRAILPSVRTNIANTFTAPQIGKFPVSTNLRIAASVAASALTIELKGLDGNDPSATNPVYVPFRNVTSITGDLSWLAITAATSLVISSGSTLGTVSGQANRLWLVGFDDGGTFRLGVINCLDSTLNIFPLQSDSIVASTAEGGAGAADSAGVFYTGTAVTSKAYTVLGYVESTQATAGTWATAPSKIQPWMPGMKLPGDIVQSKVNATGASTTGTTVLPHDDTIPQNTEGDEYMTTAITPVSDANLLGYSCQAQLSSSAAAGSLMVLAIFRDSTASALKVSSERLNAADASFTLNVVGFVVSGTKSSTTLKARAGGSSAGTTTFNGRLGVRTYGGVLNSFLDVQEIMV